jgi:hypothetical protein
MGRILNGKNRSPVTNGMSPILLAEVVRTLEQARLALLATETHDPEVAQGMRDRTQLMINALLPKLTR